MVHSVQLLPFKSFKAMEFEKFVVLKEEGVSQEGFCVTVSTATANSLMIRPRYTRQRRLLCKFQYRFCMKRSRPDMASAPFHQFQSRLLPFHSRDAVRFISCAQFDFLVLLTN